jgi:hypothetical protein
MVGDGEAKVARDIPHLLDRAGAAEASTFIGRKRARIIGSAGVNGHAANGAGPGKVDCVLQERGSETTRNLLINVPFIPAARLQKTRAGALPTVQQRMFSAVEGELKVVPDFSMAQATLRRRSATDRKARPWLWPRLRRVAYFDRLLGSR